MKTKQFVLLFSIVALIQLAVPTSMIWENQKTIENGTVYKFKTAPIDPNDPFIGKYIALQYALESFPSKDSIWESGDPVFIYLGKDTDGFATLKKAVKNKEKDNPDDYVIAKVNYNFDGVVHFIFPFNTYYMEESKAYDAETAYREQVRDTTSSYPTYALVHVKDGKAVLSDVIIKNTPIKEYVRKK
ncbi:GDYXXLXY domain-containing protein [Flavobacterium cerinum]|uniref:GDYXXLXY domain-containing protein n=1 Tax=Flavobacterium cerinum TaxID=2502784 RepID=A0ABY5IVI1_9FLAO|nr:GDYXXLXY domain-containing protein [Flavobacterium cerinum]UUC46162.1 GDYXXLXY domain-containing protein [Flavobacterium cerinum]